jgi:hypothetical protein
VPGQSQTALRDGSTWPVGSEDEVAWINAGVTRGMSITASIPPVFAAYATLAFPLDLDAPRERLRPREDRFDDTLLRVLSRTLNHNRGGSGSLRPELAMLSWMKLHACTCTATGRTSSYKRGRRRPGTGAATRDAGTPRYPS